MWKKWKWGGLKKNKTKKNVAPHSCVRALPACWGKVAGCCSLHPLGGLFVALASTFQLLCGLSRWERRRVGPELPLFSLSRSLIHEAAPPACHRPAYTVYGTNAELFLLLSRLPSAQAHSIRHLLPDDASTSLGCRAEKFPRWQPFKPPSLQHRRHPDQHRGFSWSGDMITDKRETKRKKKDSPPQIFLFLQVCCWRSDKNI